MKIAVAGTGYVGLVAGVCFADKGYDVTCVDVDEEKLQLMRRGISPIYESGLEELMRKNNAAGRLHYTSDYKAAYKNADVIFIGVGTPEQPDGSANLTYITAAAKQIAESVERDCLVVVKSTVPVGTNDEVERLITAGLKHDVKIEVASNPEFERYTSCREGGYRNGIGNGGKNTEGAVCAVWDTDSIGKQAHGRNDKIRVQ